MACDTIKIETLDADEVVSIVTAGPQGPSGSEAATLTTTGDLLYRAALANDRLPIGSEGQVLKVSGGLPAWGNESGAVTEVNGQTGAVTLTASDVGAQGAFQYQPLSITGNVTLSPSRATYYSITAASAVTAKITLPSGQLVGDRIIIASISPWANEASVAVQPFLNSYDVVTFDQSNRTYEFLATGTSSGGWQLINQSPLFLSAQDITSGTLDIARIPTGTTSTTVCIGDDARLSDARPPTSHTHGNLTNDGKVGSTSGLPLKTGTAGVVEAGAFGTSAGEFAEGNHTHTQLHDKSHTMTDATSHTAGNHKVFYSDGSGNVQELALGNSGEVLTSNGASAAPSFAAASGGIGGSTGATDNAILRADGTGGDTAQAADIVIDDATTSTQANVALVNNHSETNSALVLSPKGTGAFIIGPKPDGTSTGGNARGLKAVDLSHQRSAATQVASGNYSMVLGGDRCTASSTTAIAGGEVAAASGAYAIALGRSATASGTAGVVVGGQTNTTSGAEAGVFSGDTNTASGNNSCVLAGNYGVADRAGLIAQGNGRFAANGDSQWIHMVLRAKTTTNSAVELLINNLRTTNGRLTCPSGKIISGIINIHGVKSDGTASAHYVRQFQVKNVGGTSSYPYTAATVGTDYASSTSITFNDPDTNGDALSVSVTGIASETWRWTAHVSAVETTYGS